VLVRERDVPRARNEDAVRKLWEALENEPAGAGDQHEHEKRQDHRPSLAGGHGGRDRLVALPQLGVEVDDVRVRLVRRAVRFEVALRTVLSAPTFPDPYYCTHVLHREVEVEDRAAAHVDADRAQHELGKELVRAQQRLEAQRHVA
jgi:hypothetical protein